MAGGTPVPLPPLWWQNSGTESARTFSLINPYHVLGLWPALCGLGSAPGQTAHVREPQTIQAQTGAKRAEQRKEGGVWKERDFSGCSSPLAEKFFEINKVGVV